MKCHHSLQNLAAGGSTGRIAGSCFLPINFGPGLLADIPSATKKPRRTGAWPSCGFSARRKRGPSISKAYNIARERLDAALARRQGEEKLAVIMDIDETILDNSPFEADLIKTGKTFSEKIVERMGLTVPSPGRCPVRNRFSPTRRPNQVEVFYVSNRNTMTSTTRRETCGRNIFRWWTRSIFFCSKPMKARSQDGKRLAASITSCF